MRRRSFLQLAGLGVLAAGGVSACGPSTGSTGAVLRSALPLPTPFTTPLPVPDVLRGEPAAHGAGTAYRMTARVHEQEILPGYRTRILGYEGSFPGPSICARRGEPLRLALRNELGVDTVLHLHGGRTPPEHDGYPTDLISTGRARDYRYPLDQRAATLWYHDHAMDFTGPNVYAGLAGMFLISDDEEAALGLPRGTRDLPLMIADRSFGPDAELLYPALHSDRSAPGVTADFHGGVLGDCVLVNGAPWPVLEVDAARYRFRLLNASNARRYELTLDQGVGFVQVGTDLGLLSRPVQRSTVTLAGAERVEVILDFSDLALGTRVTMGNRLGEGGAGQVMQFHVVRRASDDSRVPERLSTIERIDPSRVSVTRDLHFALGPTGGGGGAGGHGHDAPLGRSLWSVNGVTFASGRDVARPRLGTVERWRLSSDVHHPVHAHLVGFQVDGPGDAGPVWKDTIDLLPGSAAEVLVPIDGYRGRYVMHCHNLEHEDMMMMANFTVV